MARKSNKTAHVLNLLAGHDAQNTPEEASAKEAEASSSPASAAAASESASTSKPAADTEASPAPNPAQNISVIDTTGDDPLADLIQQKLSDEFGDSDTQNTAGSADHTSGKPTADASAESADTKPVTASTPINEPPKADAAASEPITTDTTDPRPASEAAPAAEAAAKKAPAAEAPASIEAAAPVMDAAPVKKPVLETAPEEDSFSFPHTDHASSTETISVPGPEQDTNTMQVPLPESVPGPGPSVPKPESVKEPEPEPEPEFVYLNIMEEIVKDKIIYFMRQFDVCTCGRCKADTIALTMNGLMPKYIVTAPAAVDPLLSYYTNRLISDVTVEATKACMTIKEHPRH